MRLFSFSQKMQALEAILVGYDIILSKIKLLGLETIPISIILVSFAWNMVLSFLLRSLKKALPLTSSKEDDPLYPKRSNREDFCFPCQAKPLAKRSRKSHRRWDRRLVSRFARPLIPCEAMPSASPSVKPKVSG